MALLVLRGLRRCQDLRMGRPGGRWGFTRTRRQSWIFGGLYGLVGAGQWALVITGGPDWIGIFGTVFLLLFMAYLVSALCWRNDNSDGVDDVAKPTTDRGM